MSEQELARALVQAGLLTVEQARQAARERSGQRGFAQVVVDRGWVEPARLREIDSFALPAQSTPAQSTPAQSTPAATPQDEAAYEAMAGLGSEGAPALDDSGVHIHDEDDRERDEDLNVIIRFCNELLHYAAQLGASDMHLEPRSDGLLPRYRVDGRLQTGELIPESIKAPIISRFKVVGNLDIGENRLPQDGRFRATIGGRVYDFRVSTLPSIHGEKVVIRLLDRSSLVTDLTRLGFLPEHHEAFMAMLRRSHGMILVTGPTGSGKTTTLYAALAAARDETKNVVTVEDPVEYELEGVTQTKVHPEIGLTFAAQLRAILRQDPDVILVGEIRDHDTAEMAVRAALTGHLVLSTLHTNSAAAAVARLQDMEVPPYLLASSLAGVLAQRLVRLICRHCRAPLPQDDPSYETARVRLKLRPGTTLYYGAGCEACGGTGQRGRIALIEMMPMNNALRRAIMSRQDAARLQELAMEQGMTTLWQDGLDKLKRGLISADELIRVLLGAEESGDEAESAAPSTPAAPAPNISSAGVPAPDALAASV
jgi:type II secretory ATPase GspE/PulE/Tfp pilus assembly ATPase PilB-like protein